MIHAARVALAFFVLFQEPPRAMVKDSQEAQRATAEAARATSERLIPLQWVLREIKYRNGRREVLVDPRFFLLREAEQAWFLVGQREPQSKSLVLTIMYEDGKGRRQVAGTFSELVRDPKKRLRINPAAAKAALATVDDDARLEFQSKVGE